MLLIEPTTEYIQQLMDYRREFIDSGSSTDGTGSFLAYEDMSQWLDKVETYKTLRLFPRGGYLQRSTFL